MNDREALLRAVCEHLDDDLPRLITADWLEEYGEPERAEFIRLQIESARRFVSGSPLDTDADAICAAELEREHGTRWWLGCPPSRHGVTFGMWRGFPFKVSAQNRRALQRAEHSPPGLMAVEYLTLDELTPGAAKYFAGRWYTSRIRLLEIRGGGWGGMMRELLNGADWSGLRYLSLRGWDISYSGAAAVAEYPGFRSLQVLDLGQTEIGNAGVVALCRSPYLNGLTCLRLDGNIFTEPVHEELRSRFGERVHF